MSNTHNWEDISTEEWREYEFANGYKVKIEGPLTLARNSNGHRILDSDGISHYIPTKWVHLYWKAKPGRPPFIL